MKSKLEADQGTDFANKVQVLVNNYSKFAEKNEMFFFPEYTNHGIGHIERVLEIVDKLIPDNTFEKLTYQDIGVIIIAVVLHDIGMQTNVDLFENMINGNYDKVRKSEFGDKTWNELWAVFLKESKYWDDTKKNNVLGDKPNTKVIVEIPNLKDSSIEKKYDRKLIGEFIRKHHHRLADDIVSMDYIRNKVFKFNEESEDNILLQCLNLAGLVARSHGMALRDTFDYLKSKNPGTRWSEPRNTHIVYLMVLLRLADLLDMKKDRTNQSEEEVKKMSSPLSRLEHAQHKAIWDVKYGGVNDKEKIDVEVVLTEVKDDLQKGKKDFYNKENVKIYDKIKDYVDYIQDELDKSWAVLGEVYRNKFALEFRRIEIDNITDEYFEDTYKLIPKQFKFRLNDDLAKLLVEPLYGDYPTFGVRELVQNAVDACRECMDKDPHVDVKLDTKKGIFTIKDTGKGMTLEEIENYFLTIGSSFKDNIDWQKIRDDKHIYRTGCFGIGVLASFLLGDRIIVETRSRNKNESGYRFEISLSDKFVFISKKEKLNYGTKIEIKCKETSLRKLIKDVNYKDVNYKNVNYEDDKHYEDFEDDGSETKWYNWYIDEKPIVKYFCDGKKIFPSITDDFNRYRELKHKSVIFGVIRFKTYGIFCDTFLFEKYLYCNGFFITSESKKRDFCIPNLENYYPFGIPSLQITDKQNKLPINLNRTNLEKNYKYDFEDDLAKEVCKNFICEYLAITNISTAFVDSCSNCYFCKDGFTFNNLYTKKKLSNKYIIYLNFSDNDKLVKYLIYYFMNEWYAHYDKKQKYIFYFINKLSNEQITKTVAIHDDEFREVTFNLDLNFMNGKSLYYKKYNLYSNNSSKHFKLLKMIIDWWSPKNLKIPFALRAISIVETNSQNFKDSQSLELNNLFDNYLDEDPIIPYNIEDRKNKFKKIFDDKELSKIIDYYIQIDMKKSSYKSIINLPSSIYKKGKSIEKFFQPEENIDVVLID